MVFKLDDIQFSFKLAVSDWRSVSTPSYSCVAAHIHMDAQQLIGGGLNGFDELGILGMWPWLSSCSLGAAADNKPEFLSVSDQDQEKKPARRKVLIICSFPITNSELVSGSLKGNHL